MSRRRVVLLGSTGSIGTQALDVVRAHPDRFEVVALAAGRDSSGLREQLDEFAVRSVAVADPVGAAALRADRPDLEVVDGPRAASEVAGRDTDLVVNGITGAVGLEPTLAALRAGTPVALANKESLIVGGDLVIAAAELAGGRETYLIPVDSEHSALAQCLRGGRRAEVERLVLTASGGPFRGRSRAELAEVTPAQALDHPTWSMGPVITVNSATLMNKGLELIEAHELFDIGWDALDVVVHPQSVVHSMVEFVDGSTIAQLSPPDMRLPIQLGLGWPDRLDWAPERMNWTQALSLTFEPVDHVTFPMLSLAIEAGRQGGAFPGIYNAANEEAVGAFLGGRVDFLGIPAVVEATLEAYDGAEARELSAVLAAEQWARRHAQSALERRAATPA